MSPLLCQLSYTATSGRSLREVNLTRGGIALSMERQMQFKDPRLQELATALAAWAAGRESVFGEGAS